MKMAKATKEDIDAAFLISRILSDVADPRNFSMPAFPPRLDGEYHDDDPQSFDWSDPDHVEALRERLVGAMNKGSLSRVLFLGREMPGLIRGISDEMLEEERIKYLVLLDEPCEVVHVPADVVRKRKVTTPEEGEGEE